MLSFIGTGAAFNTKLGNNCAYIKKGNVLFLIDCGSNIFTKLQNSKLLKDVEHLLVLVTHTHPDHIGSLGDLIFYGYYSMGQLMQPNVIVYAPKEVDVKTPLEAMGVKEKTYKLIQFEDTAGFRNQDFEIQFKPIKVTHVAELNCFGYELLYEGKFYYYSGDSNMIPKQILGNIDRYVRLYQDTCKLDYDGNVHLSLKKLAELILPADRSKFYCMHLDKDFKPSEAKALGFNVVKNSLQ